MNNTQREQLREVATGMQDACAGLYGLAMGLMQDNPDAANELGELAKGLRNGAKVIGDVVAGKKADAEPDKPADAEPAAESKPDKAAEGKPAGKPAAAAKPAQKGK